MADGSQLEIENVKVLSDDSYTGRRTGTDGAFKTKTYLINAFTAQNVLPLFETLEQPFSFKNNIPKWKKIKQHIYLFFLYINIFLQLQLLPIMLQ